MLIACLLFLSGAPAGQAQDWAAKMFDRTSHNFGTVARGSKVDYRFTITNLYVEDVHIAGVRSSCGCTTPQVVNQTLKSREKGEIVAQFNTQQFLGDKTATLTVTFDKPYFAEVQLQVGGYIRSDVVLDPGLIDFGSVDQGSVAERRISVRYAGRDNWQIVDVLSANRHLEAELQQTARGGGQVSYDLVVRLKADTPPGYIKDQLTLVTDDQRAKHIPIDIEGRVNSELTVSPASLLIGVRQPGEKVTKRLVVQGRKPFRIVNVECDDDCFSFELPDTSKQLHLITVNFVAGEKPGKIVDKIRITTDLGGEPLELSVFADVLQPETKQ
jgi:hypothetical protein